LGHDRAYICPPKEIADEGSLRIDVMAEWGLPRATIDQLRQSLGLKIKSDDVATARSALRAIFEESDSWSSYFEDYHESMWRYTWWLFGAIVLFTPAAILLIHRPQLMLYALFLAGGVGSCASVISKVPVPELRFSSEFQGYLPRILGRIGAGTVVSLVASAIIGWGIPEFRAAPLWGLGQRLFFLHDGRTSDLLEAIRAHKSGSIFTGDASEANAVIRNFNHLRANQQQDVLNFLRSL